MLPNRESGPQNQPKAKVAVSISVGTEASIAGIVTLGTIFISCLGMLVSLQPSSKTGTSNDTMIMGINILTIIAYFKHHGQLFSTKRN